MGLIASLSMKNTRFFIGFCEHRALAPRASLCSTLAMFIGIKIDAHVADFYGFI